MCFSVRGVRPGGGLLLSGLSPRWQRLLQQPAELHTTEDDENTGNSTSRAEDWCCSSLLTCVCH